MKGNMSRTIEAIIQKLAHVKRAPMPTSAKQLTATWHNGLEAGGHVQRKLRLVFTNVVAHQPVN
jgi:hypothetical protein